MSAKAKKKKQHSENKTRGDGKKKKKRHISSLPCEHFLNVDLVKWVTTHIARCTTRNANHRSQRDGDGWETDGGIKQGSISASRFPNGSLSWWPMAFTTTPTSPYFCWIGEWVCLPTSSPGNVWRNVRTRDASRALRSPDVQQQTSGLETFVVTISEKSIFLFSKSQIWCKELSALQDERQ